MRYTGRRLLWIVTILGAILIILTEAGLLDQGLSAINVSHDLVAPADRVAFGLGEALVIAGVLGFTVDRMMKESVMREVAPYFFTYQLPNEATSLVRWARGISLLRENTLITYTFLPHEDDNCVEVRTEIEYELENYADEPDTHHVRIGFTGGGTSSHEEILFVSATGTDISPGNINKNDFDPGEEFDKDVKVSPNKGDVRNHIVLKTREIFPHDHADVLFIREPTRGVRVKVQKDAIPNLHAEVSVGNHNRKNVQVYGDEHSRTWELKDTLFLPWQAVSLEWELRGEPEECGEPLDEEEDVVTEQ